MKGRNVVAMESTVHVASEGLVELLLFEEETGAMTYTPSVSQRDSLSTTTYVVHDLPEDRLKYGL